MRFKIMLTMALATTLFAAVPAQAEYPDHPSDTFFTFPRAARPT